jgi:ribosomal protein S18 acetylase RimI-like enzyme
MNISLITIRPAIPADLHSLLLIENSSFTGERLSKRRLRHWIRASNGILLVATIKEQIRGYVLSFTRRNSLIARLYSLAISEEFRGHGLGHQLLLACEGVARERGVNFLSLEVNVNNLQALRLYEKLGFLKQTQLGAYYEDGSDAFKMLKSLH